MAVERHKHTWLWWDWEKVNYNDLTNIPLKIEITSPTNWQVLTYDASTDTWRNV